MHGCAARALRRLLKLEVSGTARMPSPIFGPGYLGEMCPKFHQHLQVMSRRHAADGEEQAISVDADFN